MHPMIAFLPVAGRPAPGFPHPPALGVAAFIAWLLTASLGAGMARAWIAHGGLRRRRAGGEDLPPGVVLGHAGLAVTGLLVWASYLAAGWTALAWSAAGLLMLAIGLGVSTVTLWTPYPVRRPAAGLPGTGPSGTVVPPGAASPGTGPPATGPPGTGPSGTVPPGAASPGTGRPAGPGGAGPPEFEVTDEMIAALLTGPPPTGRRARTGLSALIPVAHGIGAITTFLLAVLTAAGMT